MDSIPGLDMLNASEDGHQPYNIPDQLFEMPANIVKMRTEADFNVTENVTLRTGIFLFKGYEEKSRKDITLVVYDQTQEYDYELGYILHELEIIRNLDHNNVLKFYETIAGNRVLDVGFIFEPYGGLLSKFISQKIEKLYEPPVIKTIMKELFTALSYLHRNGIIHMNIQPENIAFTSAGVLKVWNFRYACRVGQKPKKIKVNEFRYQPVELLLETGKYDESVDIWSANCIFAQLWLKKTFCTDHGREKVLEGIFKLLGFPKKEIWEEFYSFPGINDLKVFETIYRYNMLDKRFKNHDQVISPKAMNLMHRCFRFNPKYRPRAEYCLLHPYFIEEPKACPMEEIITVLENSAICNQLQAMKNNTSI